MKKIFFLSTVAVFTLILSGCGCSQSAVAPAKQYTFSQSIWKSTDGGKTWVAKDKTDKKPNVTELDVLQIAINKQDSSNIYIGLRNGGMIKSTDGGENWEPTSFTSAKVYGLEINPDNGQVLYVSGVWQGRGKIFKTEDGGENWTEIYTKAADGPLVISLTLDQKNTSIVYATTSDNEVLKSLDGGKSWQNIYRSSAPVLKVAIDRSDSNLIYLLDQTGAIFKSTDGGKTIKDISENVEGNSFSNQSFITIKTDPTISGRIYLVGSGGIIRSDDAGEKWKKMTTLDNPQNFPITTLAINPYNSDEIVYGSSQAAFMSIDGGNSWTPFQFSVSRKTNFIQYDPQNTSNIYLGFSK